MKKLSLFVALLFITLVFTGCGKQAPIQTCALTGSLACWTTWWAVDHSDLSGAVQGVLLALKNNDMTTLSTFVSAEWLRFSPYEHVNIQTDVVLHAQEVTSGLSLSMSYTRGAYDGSWEPIKLTIWQYFKKFVYDADFTNAPEVHYNQNVQRGNIINNISAVYPGTQSRWVEFYFPKIDPQYEGMDRKSLTLVFGNRAGQ